MRTGILFVVALLALTFSSNSQAQTTGERALYLSGNQTLMGCIYRPQGKGPFPVVVYSQHAPKPLSQSGPIDPFPQLAKLFVSKGYILFVPGRHEPVGTKFDENEGRKGDGTRMIKNHEDHAQNLLAAVAWVKAQHDVDDNRISILGEAAGGISTLFAVTHGLDVRAMVLFSPGVKGMKTSYDLQSKLRDAVQTSTAPIFLIQSENDVNLLPKTVFGPVLSHKGSFNEVKVYPPFGETAMDAHRFAQDGSAVWQRDVLSFLNLAMN